MLVMQSSVLQGAATAASSRLLRQRRATLKFTHGESDSAAKSLDWMVRPSCTDTDELESCSNVHHGTLSVSVGGNSDGVTG